MHAVQAYRDALQAEEAKQWATKRQPILEKLAGDMKKLSDAQGMGDRNFAKVLNIPFLCDNTFGLTFCDADSSSSKRGLQRQRVSVYLPKALS